MDGSVSCQQVVNFFLEQIRSKNQEINAFLEVFEDYALEKALEVDDKIKNGQAGKLAGCIIGIKDLFCLKGKVVSCGSRILQDFESQITSTAIQKLIDEDAIIIGRQNCDEFAMGSSNENSAFGPTKNPVDTDTVPGGSSGGSAAAVAANMCMASIGSDTGGSIRQPAAFCGIFGMKPNYSRISRYGLTAYSSSFDTVGTLTNSIEDAALLLEVMSGQDPNDSTSSSKPVPSIDLSVETETRKIAVLDNFEGHEGFDPVLLETFNRALESVKSRGHVIEKVNFPYLDYLLPTYYILTSAEASTNLSRYDGVRYGYRVSDPANLEAMYKKSRTKGFGTEVLRRILLGTFVLSASYQDAFYKKAQKTRQLIKEFTRELLSKYDFLMLPTTPTPAFKLGEKTKDPVEMYLSDIFTVQASMAGFPAISLPIWNDDKTPIGIQVVGGEFEESALLKFSKSIESF